MPQRRILVSCRVTYTCELSVPGQRSNDFNAVQNVRTGAHRSRAAPAWPYPLKAKEKRARSGPEAEASTFNHGKELQMALRVCPSWSLSLLLLAPLAAACSKSDDAKNDRQPPPPPPVASSAHADVCAGGGAQDTDSVSAPFIPRAAGRLLPRPAGRTEDIRRPGQAHDGRGVHDGVRRRVRGLQALRSRAGGRRFATWTARGAPNSVEVNLSRFATSDGAYAMFTKRVVADGDPARATVKPRGARGGGRDEQQQRLRLARLVPRRAHVRARRTRR